MNKMKKLLSVVLAVIMILSTMSVMASAAKTSYKTVAELEALDAYSPYGQVTRLSLEERTSIVLDFLDNVLPGLNINMGEVFNVLGLSVTIDLTSVDRLCYSLDTIKSTFENTLASIAMGIVNLGILESLETGKWTSGMSRDGTAQFTILSTLLAFLSDNTTLVGKVFTDGLDLGIVSLGDMSAIEDIIMNLPGMIKGLIYPMLERWDDTLADIQTYDNSIADETISVENIANNRIKALFSDNMSITTLKYDVNGNMTSEHTGWKANTGSEAPGTPSATSPRCYYQFSSTTPGSVMTIYHIVDAKEADTLAKDADDTNNVAAYNYIKEEQTYVMTEEVAGSGTYVWRATDEWGNTWSLKWYNDDSKWLYDDDTNTGITGDDIDLTTMSLAELLYKFVPHVFSAMAPTVLNGSVKKILADFLGASFNYVGQVGDDAVEALPDASDVFFTQEQGEYLWEWSDYAVINGNHYYRFEDQIFVGDISQKNNYFDIINWDYEIGGDFLDEFIPEDGKGSTSDTVLMNLNDFIIKVADEVFEASANTVDAISGYKATWTKPALTAGGNENLVANIKTIAQTVIGLAPQHVFGSDYAENDRCYVELMLANRTYTGTDSNGDTVTIKGVTVDETLENDTILTGIAAHIVNMVMPSMSLPGKNDLVDSKAKVGAILAAVVREFAAYLAPEYNFDALIYADFGTTTSDNVKTFVDPEAAGLLTDGQTASGYWLDVIMTMGINVGYEYLRAFADLGEDTELCAGVTSAPVNYMAEGGTYAAGTTQATLNAQWEGMVDYILDWALCNDYEWCWAMENLVDCGATIDLATAQDPWVKLDTILNALLPVDEILNVTATDCETELEQLLRYDFILALVDLRWDDLANILIVPNGFVRNTNVLDQLALKLKGIINYIFTKLGGGSYNLIPDSMTDFDSLANQANLVEMVKALVGILHTGLVTNGGCQTLFPFLNFLFGWKTDPQILADPVMGYQFQGGKDYAFQGVTDAEAGKTGKGSSASTGSAIEGTYITFLNNSAGMLETHRNSTVTDHAYDINITGVTFDATINNDLSVAYVTVDKDGNEAAADAVVSPWEKVWIKVNGTYKGDEAVTMTVTYDYVGKDGQPVGGTQYTSYTFLISGLYEDADRIGTQSGDHDTSYGGIYDFKSYVFTEDLYKTVTEYEQEIHYVSASFSNPDQSFEYCQPEGWVAAVEPTYDSCTGEMTDPGSAEVPGNVPTAPASNYFAQYKGQAGGWESTLEKEGQTTVNGLLYYALDGVTEDTEFAYGAYDMGGVGVKYGSDTKVWYVDFIYYNDYGIDEIYAENKDNNYTAYDGVDSATWEAYRTAWNKIVYLATYPMMTTARNIADWNGLTAEGISSNDYVSAIMPQIESAIEAFETAKEDFETALAEAQASGAADAALPKSVQALEDQLALDVTDKETGTKEINFQDYDFYEYFNYADLRTSHRNFVKTYYAPEVMDTYYILNSGIREAELNNVIAAESNEFIAAGITASRLQNDQEAINASKAAHNEWSAPVNSDLLIYDMAARLAYYKTFVNDSVKEPNSHLYFLEQEIAHVEAQQLNEADYTEKSWAAYAEALAEAQAVAAGNDTYATFNSRIYDVKYNLMVAYKNLLEKSRSLIEAGGTADLQTNADTANEIFASLAAGDGAWAVKDGVDADTAYAALISALGYYYTGEDGNEWNLYADSALEYLDNDRPNNQNNQAKVNTSNENLKDAIENFEPAVTEPNTLTLNENAPFEAIIDTTNCGDYNGAVYGFDTLGWNDAMEVDGTIADFLSTAYGDDYLEVIEADGGETTGALINVLDEDGNVVETYVYIYFGDVDMDGNVGEADAAMAADYELLYEGFETLYQFMAADLDADTMPGESDAGIMADWELLYEGMPTQAEIGAMVAENVYEIY